MRSKSLEEYLNPDWGLGNQKPKRKMTDKLKSFLERHNYKITALNTVLIITGIVIAFSQSNSIENKTDSSLQKQDFMIKSDLERVKFEDSVQNHLRNKLDSINRKQ